MRVGLVTLALLSACADHDRSAAQEVVTRRRAGLHDSRSRRLLLGAKNSTLYPDGYLFETKSLRFWQRERVQARALVLGGSELVPTCIDVDL